MWQLDGTKARLETSHLSCQLDLASPDSGLTHLMTSSSSDRSFHAFDAALMKLALPTKPRRRPDAYVRGNDLVATFLESEVYPCRTQVYWRYMCELDYFGIQLIISVQTSRLDASPGLQIASRVPGPARVLQGGVNIVPLPETELCYAELLDRSNIESTTVRDQQITHNLFPGSLEKGVIRRARLLVCFFHAASADEIASRIHTQLLDSAPPLTT